MNIYYKLSLFISIAGIITLACKDKDASLQSKDPSSNTKVTYMESAEDFPNPERGFYRYSETNASNFVGLDAKTLKSYRTLQKVSSANHSIYSTLVFRYYILDNVLTADLSKSLLNKINADLEAVREAGVKLIPRFVYTKTKKAGDCPDQSHCPPYGDASKEYVLRHIASLKEVLHNNVDVIACVQLGFVGLYGEQYYTDHFGDPSSNGTQRKLIDENWIDRGEVIKALLDAVPKSRMVQVRYPQQKQRYIYGVNASISSASLSENEAFTDSDKARLGFHNDCFMASSNDVGTYVDYGNSSTNRSSSAEVTETLKEYKRKDSKYVVVGGETCRVYDPYSDCEPLGKAQEFFAEMHYSYINAHYNNEVNNSWQNGGCMDNIKKNLGYRFVLQDAVFSNVASKGNTFWFSIKLQNKGYASPYNTRPVQIILRHTDTKNIVRLPIKTDIRKWYTGEITLEENLSLPINLVNGTYEVLLNMPDEDERIAKRSEYSIRLANTEVWEEASGFNKLNHTIHIK